MAGTETVEMEDIPTTLPEGTIVGEQSVKKFSDRMDEVWNALEENGYVVRSIKVERGTRKWDEFWELLSKDDTTTAMAREKLEKVSHFVTLGCIYVGESNGQIAQQILGEATYESVDRYPVEDKESD